MDENDILVTLRASVRGGMKPGYMCSTAASRQVNTPSKNTPRRRPLQNVSNEVMPSVRRNSEYVSSFVHRATPRSPVYEPPPSIRRMSENTLPRKRSAAPKKKDAATNTDGDFSEIDCIIGLLRDLNYGLEKPTCSICTGNGESGWRAMIPCGHEFCEECHVWEKESRCPICREFILEPLKVFR